MASMVMMHPFRSRTLSNSGMALISLLFASTARWPSTRRLPVDQALTTCKAGLPSAKDALRVFPAIGPAHGREDGDEDDVEQFVPLHPCLAGIGQACEMVCEGLDFGPHGLNRRGTVLPPYVVKYKSSWREKSRRCNSKTSQLNSFEIYAWYMRRPWPAIHN